MEKIEKQIYRPYWIEPDNLEKLGYTLVSDDGIYLKYTSSWKLKAMHRAGREYEQLLGDNKRIIYFNCEYAVKDKVVFCQIREDGDSRTVFKGVINNGETLELILNLVE